MRTHQEAPGRTETHRYAPQRDALARITANDDAHDDDDDDDFDGRDVGIVGGGDGDADDDSHDGDGHGDGDDEDDVTFSTIV